jgi:multicomponent Na+:H+ antiporter subunit F
MTLAFDLAYLLFLAAIALTAVRALAGPTLADRAVALDLMTTLVISVLIVQVVRTGERAFADIAVGLASAGLLGALGVARVLARRSARHGARS